jgi:hypothetical protein
LNPDGWKEVVFISLVYRDVIAADVFLAENDKDKGYIAIPFII